MKSKMLKIIALVVVFATSGTVLAAGACCAIDAICCDGTMRCCD